MSTLQVALMGAGMAVTLLLWLQLYCTTKGAEGVPDTTVAVTPA